MGIDSEGPRADELLVGIHRCALGEVGYRAAARVYGVEVADVPHLEAWYTSAMLADRFTGRSSIDGARLEQGASWFVVSGDPECTKDGLGESAASHPRFPYRGVGWADPAPRRRRCVVGNDPAGVTRRS